MKLFSKFLVLLLMVGVLAGVAHAFIPAAGIKTNFPGISYQYGAVSYDDNGTKYRMLYNNSGATVYKGQPMFYKVANVANSYTTTTYESTAYLGNFAGVVTCADDGTTSVSNGGYYWALIGGYCNYASAEGTTDITAGDWLIGSVAGGYLVYGSTPGTSATAVPTFESGVRAGSALTANAAGLVSIEVVGKY